MKHMGKHDISILCVQETRIPHSCVEDKQEYTFVFSSSSTNNDEYHGVGFCYKKLLERYRNHYQQIDSNMMNIEINMHGNSLVIITAYIPHDLVSEEETFGLGKSIKPHQSNPTLQTLNCFRGL
jgi:exonuclease III